MPHSPDMDVALGGVTTMTVAAPSVVREPAFKRAFDFVLSAVALVVTAPLLLCLALCIRFEDGGPVLFRQLRIGRGGGLFLLMKFRSMTVDPAQVEVQARSNDPRVTAIGRFMRKTGLDELPQLWNIFRGDMSFVGPRPQPERERVLQGGMERDIVVRDVPRHDIRMLVRPGLTGVAQVYAPRVIEHHLKFRYDAVYVRRVIRAGVERPRILSDLHMLAVDGALILRSAWMGLVGNREV